MTPRLIKNFFSPEVFSRLKLHIKAKAKDLEREPIQDHAFNRHSIHNDSLLLTVHEHLEEWLSVLVSEKVKKSYSFISLYREGGVCPRHTDRPQCKYTVDLCVSQDQPWPIYVDDLPYKLYENDALVYSGTDSPHYRQRLVNGSHCFLIFFHFVPIGFHGSLD